jgi:hypothetical protein
MALVVVAPSSYSVYMGKEGEVVLNVNGPIALDLCTPPDGIDRNMIGWSGLWGQPPSMTRFRANPKSTQRSKAKGRNETHMYV